MIQVGISIAKTVTTIGLASSCDVYAMMQRLDECKEEEELVMRLTQTQWLVGLIGLLLDFHVKLWWTIRQQQHWSIGRMMSRWLPGAGSPLESDHWVPAATRSFFLETALAVRSTRALTLLLQLPTLVLAASLTLVPSLLSLKDVMAEGSHDIPTMCQEGAGSSVACQVMVWRRFVLQVSWTPVYILAVMYLTTPRLMWGAIAEKAAAAVDDIGLMRLGMLPWLLLPLAFGNTVLGLVFYFFLWGDHQEVNETLLFAWFAGCLILIVSGVIILSWTRVVQETVELLSKRLRKRQRSTRKCIAQNIYPTTSRSDPEDDLVAPFSFSEGWQRNRRSVELDPSDIIRREATCDDGTRTQEQRMDYSSAYHQKLVLLHTAIFLHGSLDGTGIADTVCLWVMRILTIVAMLLTKDKQSSHDDLRRHGAALGLVLDANVLLRALRQHQKGGRLVETIPQFRATILRMRRTLAVSYRWQPSAISITSDGGMSLNMSSFQIQALVEQIPKSGCCYVWIDKMSVCQEPGSELQKKLLARMLAVFCSAQVTLAIRTIEDAEDSRYHKRAWTAQVGRPDCA